MGFSALLWEAGVAVLVRPTDFARRPMSRLFNETGCRFIIHDPDGPECRLAIA
jgi:hypothetical protein